MKSKRILSILMFLTILASTLTISAAALEATPAASTVIVNGKTVAFDAYLIDGNNYFKLRDLAYTLNGSTKQFSIGFDGALYLIIGQPYTPVGGEMEGKGAGIQSPVHANSKIIKDGIEIKFDAYIIGSNNYFKLRDIGEVFDFWVGWDGARKAIVIDTSKGYTPDNAATTVTGENRVPQDFTDGYELAVFSKFNSPASENGLDGTKVYLDCHIDRIVLMNDDAAKIIIAYLADNSNNNWVALLHEASFVNENEFNSVIGKSIIFCGTYEGFSGTEKMPIVCLDELCVKNTGEIKSGVGKILSATADEDNATESDIKLPQNTNPYDFSKKSEIINYLQNTYPSVDTATGAWDFEYSIIEHNMEAIQEDYTLWVEYDLGQMNDITFSNKYTQTQKDETKQQLKSFMKTIADDLLSKVGDKKIIGSYYYSYYKYPNIEVDLVTLYYCTWANYAQDWFSNYSDTPVSTFRWLPSFDEEVW